MHLMLIVLVVVVMMQLLRPAEVPHSCCNEKPATDEMDTPALSTWDYTCRACGHNGNAAQEAYDKSCTSAVVRPPLSTWSDWGRILLLGTLGGGLLILVCLGIWARILS